MSSMGIFFIVLLLPICIWILYIFTRALILFPIEIYKSNLKQGVWKYKFSVIFFILIISPYFYFKHSQEIRWRNVLPVELETNGNVLIHESFDFREGCAIGIFKLSNSTVNSINSKGLKFFESVTKPRKPENKGWEFEDWSTIHNDRAHNDRNNRNIRLINCERELDKRTINELYTAISTGGYVTYDSSASLVVIPSLKYVIYSYGS